MPVPVSICTQIHIAIVSVRVWENMTKWPGVQHPSKSLWTYNAIGSQTFPHWKSEIKSLPTTHLPVEVQMTEFVWQALIVIRSQSYLIQDNVVVGRPCCTITHWLWDQEKVKPGTGHHKTVQERKQTLQHSTGAELDRWNLPLELCIHKTEDSIPKDELWLPLRWDDTHPHVHMNQNLMTLVSSSLLWPLKI